MKILFLTILGINSISDRGIFSDLMRKFRDEGHDVYIVTPAEYRYKQRTMLINKDKVTLLKIHTLNIQKTNALQKWISTLLISNQFKKGIKKFFSKIEFDLVIYSTPPITFTKLISYIKQKDGAISYLLLKDIFPQNAVDIGLIRKGSLFHKYFVKKEKKLYEISDFIGCMSQANVDFIREQNPEIDSCKIEINPNSHELFDEIITTEQKLLVRSKYKIPTSKTVFIYGGNLGKPQGVKFIIDFLDTQMYKPGIFFLIVGSGTEFNRIKMWFDLRQTDNMMLLPELPKQEYNLLLQSCNIGMIFLDNRFTIPNFPSRLLSYLEYRMPVIAATDKSTDIGKIMVENNFGLWSESGDLLTIDQNINKLAQDSGLRETMGINGFNYFKNHYTVNNSYNIIIKHFNKV